MKVTLLSGTGSTIGCSIWGVTDLGANAIQIESLTGKSNTFQVYDISQYKQVYFYSNSSSAEINFQIEMYNE